ncbi:uncharacterized protein LOC121856182 [Homarus americanus]|uniref:uncharacterized protein LOC121856182 n=1 Tax=Homarus americanus TaxID=6706 RepID=UPI001C482DCA|nr:uncharacterized protein LOC121856182 [Homarus americanus]
MVWRHIPHLRLFVQYLVMIMEPAVVPCVTMELDNYTNQDVCFGKYFKAVSKFGQVVLSSTFMSIYQTLDDTDKGTLPLKDYCLKKLNWSLRNLNKIFNTSERLIITKVPTDHEFVCDVSLLFKIIMEVLRNLPDTIKKDIRDLKNLRNTVCHEDLQMDEVELKRRIEELKSVCQATLKGTAALTGKDLSSIMAEVENGLQSLLKARLEHTNIISYMQDLESFRRENHSKMISRGRKELMRTYSETNILNPCSWLSDKSFEHFTVDNIFTTLKIVGNGTNVMMHDILNVESLKMRFVPRMVIVKGVMGAGKTSLYRYLLSEWCKLSTTITGLMAVDIVIGIEMRTVCCGSLIQFLREQLLKNTSRMFNKIDIIPVLQDINVLFIIDGMDEATSQGKNLVKEIVHKFTQAKIIITTRPEMILELMQMAEDHIVLQIEGFDEENQHKFLEKIFALKYPDKSRQKEETNKFVSYMEGARKSLAFHFTLPLTLALSLILWCDDSQKVITVSTTTRLYQNIYEMCQQKLTSRLVSLGWGHAVSVSRKVRRWLLTLGHIAWCMMREEALHLSQEHTNHLIDLCETEGIDAIQTLSTFLNCEGKKRLTGPLHCFSFHHSSGQEFLAAMYISEQVTTSQSLSSIFKDIESSRFQVLILYIAGLLKINNKMTASLAGEIKNILTRCMTIHDSDPIILWRLLEEAEKDPAVCDVVAVIVSQTEFWVINSWDSPETTEAKLNLLKQTGTAPFEVMMQVLYTKSISECPHLMVILELLGNIGKSQVKLYLDRHFHSAGLQEDVDSHVVPLLKVNKLLEYKGEAGEWFTKHLERATQVQSLFIRVTSLKALIHLSGSIRKHRHWKTKIMPSRKWNLKYIELFLDISKCTKICDIPQLNYRKQLVVKMVGITDSYAEWAGEVLNKLAPRYSSVILQESPLTASVGMKRLLKAAANVNMNSLRVMSEQTPAQEEVDRAKSLASKHNISIGYYNI